MFAKCLENAPNGNTVLHAGKSYGERTVGAQKGINETHCPVCGKFFIFPARTIYKGTEWLSKKKQIFFTFCSYTCWRKFTKERDEYKSTVSEKFKEGLY